MSFMPKGIAAVFVNTRNLLTRGFARFRALSRWLQIVIVVIVLALVGLLVWQVKGRTAETAVTPTTKTVAVSSVAALASGAGSISLTGTVTSLHEATLRAETSGNLVGVYKKLGDTVGAGEAIAEFENSAERASVLQAQGAYESAVAGSNIADVNRTQSTVSVADSRTSAYNAIRSVYSTLDDSVRVKTDGVFSNPEINLPTFTLLSSDSQSVTSLQNKRQDIEQMLKQEQAANATLENLSDDDLAAAIDARIADLKSSVAYFDTLSLVLSHTFADGSHSQASIDGYRAAASGARSAVAGSLSALTGVKTAFNAARSAEAAAGHQSSTDTGAVTTASAGVKQALGALQGAKARLADTIVYSPINGTIISLPVSSGDYVGVGSPIATVSNDAALEIVTYINEDDARAVAVGGAAHIEGGIAGVITRVAPALDPITKKIEVRIGITDAGTLTNGATVRVDLDRVAATAKSAAISLPLAAIKILPDSAGVFTVATSGALVLTPVVLGTVTGDTVVIASGVTDNMTIVTDARGLKAGDIVTIQTQ